MKYFKHLVDSGDDPDVGEAIIRYGYAGYYVFFRTLEIMAREFNVSSPGQNSFNLLWFISRFQMKMQRKTLFKILEFFKSRGRIYHEIKEDYIELKCPKLRDLSDEYTQKILRLNRLKSPDKVRTDSGESPPAYTAYKDKDKDKDNKNKNIGKLQNLKIMGILQKPKNGFCTLCLTILLIDGIKTFDEGAKVPEYGSALFLKWVDEIRKMRELDKRSKKVIFDLIIFSQESDFWRSNILSTKKLRDKSTTLLHQSKTYYEAERERNVGRHK